MRNSQRWALVLCMVALVGVAGCSSDDDLVDEILNGDEINMAAAEAAVEEAAADESAAPAETT